MVAIGFSVLKDKIIKGEKRQTIRPDSKKWRIVCGHFDYKEPVVLQLYWHLRQKDCELLREEKLSNIYAIRLGEITEEQAILDGFESKIDALEWFHKKYPKKEDNETFWIIRW